MNLTELYDIKNDPEGLKAILKVLDIELIDISKEKNYWLVRTEGGIFFSDFYFGEFVAIRYNKINNIELIKSGKEEYLRKEIEKLYPEESRPGLIIKQLKRFINEMAKGDIVIIPSRGSEHIAIGEIIDDDIYLISDSEYEELLAEDACHYIKRRKIKWLKTIPKAKIDPYLYKLLNSHHSITSANEYASFIDRSLYSFFKKGDSVHIIFEVEESKRIQAVDIIGFIGGLLNGVDIFNATTGSNYNKNDIDLKINVQSPGPIEFIAGISLAGAFILGYTAIIGGNSKIKLPFGLGEISIETPGIVGQILKYIEISNQNKLQDSNSQQCQEVVNKMKRLKIKSPLRTRKKEEDNDGQCENSNEE